MSLARSLERRQRIAAMKQAKRAARKVRFPKDFDGVVMWCPRCYVELRRIPEGEDVPPAEQQRIVDEHRGSCRAVS